MNRSHVRFGVLAMCVAGALLNGANCYRAEVDLTPLLDGPSQSGSGVVMVGEAGRGGNVEATGGGADGGASGGSDGGASGRSDGGASGRSDGGASGRSDGGASGGSEGGASGAPPATPTCDPTPEDAVQHECRRRKPSEATCDEQDVAGWNGCYDGGCSVCTVVLSKYPYYLARHPCCEPNKTCSVHAPRRCSSLCPPPTEHDKLPFCFELAR
jgi:hypothetical protein